MKKLISNQFTSSMTSIIGTLLLVSILMSCEKPIGEYEVPALGDLKITLPTDAHYFKVGPTATTIHAFDQLISI